MQIEIDDSLPGKERRRLLRIEPIKYALDKFNNHRGRAAKWLGICIRSLRNIINENPELKEYKIQEKELTGDYYQELLNSLTDEQRCRYNDEFEKIERMPGWRYADQDRRNLLLKRLMRKYLKKDGGTTPIF